MTKRTCCPDFKAWPHIQGKRLRLDGRTELSSVLLEMIQNGPASDVPKPMRRRSHAAQPVIPARSNRSAWTIASSYFAILPVPAHAVQGTAVPVVKSCRVPLP